MKTINTSIHRRNAKVAGFFFIAATVTAIIGLKLYDPILLSSEYLITGVKNYNQIILGAIFESILGISAIGTAIMMYPYLRKFNESWGLAYVCFRLLEAVFIFIGSISMLSIVTLSKAYMNPAGEDVTAFQVSAGILKSIHDWTFVMGPHFILGVNTFIYSTIFYKSGLVPKKLSMLGKIGAILIFSGAILELFGIVSQTSALIVVIALPIAIYEMILAGWLIKRGFNLQADEQEQISNEIKLHLA